VNVATLPRDPEALQAIILEQDRRIEQLERYLHQFRRWQLGVKSERIHPAQLLLEFAGQIESAPSQESPASRAASGVDTRAADEFRPSCP